MTSAKWALLVGNGGQLLVIRTRLVIAIRVHIIVFIVVREHEWINLEWISLDGACCVIKKIDGSQCVTGTGVAHLECHLHRGDTGRFGAEIHSSIIEGFDSSEEFACAVLVGGLSKSG